MKSSPYWIVNARLESGYEWEEGVISGTRTELCDLLIENGKITRIVPSSEILEDGLPKKDAKGLLILPSMAEKHIHLEKTYFGGPWKATTPVKSLFERHAEDRGLLPMYLKQAQTGAENILSLLVETGVTHVRTHCHVDPQVGLGFLEGMKSAFETYADRVSHEIVAFPHYGMLRTQARDMVREALRQGATHVGGVDPGGVDGDIERSLQTMLELAVEADADIDMHLHDPGHLGVFTMKRLAALTEEAGWQGRVTISHAMGLGDVSQEEARELAQRLASLGISIASTVPINRPTIPIPLLHQEGVAVMLGNDSLTDNWTPFGSGDLLEKAGRLAERFRLTDERSLGVALGFVTEGRITLDESGNRLWPLAGDEASLMAVEATCSAEAVARRAKRKVVLFQGNRVAGEW
ncbi:MULTISPECIES: amidohydrolase [Brevibacillus]|uniref:Deaminase n=1 Tax=Brevibacillus brevis TaxID=1393 RepID=A0A2Z4MFA6_BREBE|nr:MULTISPECIES: amidohydrolase [Brevibacillus]AWX55041.1 deaminase [Brevibacillus brevis]NRR22444.1 amidohydrolase family protein [Brevibacillus sp. MS2.2]